MQEMNIETFCHPLNQILFGAHIHTRMQCKRDRGREREIERYQKRERHTVREGERKKIPPELNLNCGPMCTPRTLMQCKRDRKRQIERERERNRVRERETKRGRERQRKSNIFGPP